jgi:hypothetical protein
LGESNVPHRLRWLKGKVAGDCAEAVEDRNFLWKVPEKSRRKSAREAGRISDFRLEFGGKQSTVRNQQLRFFLRA